MSATCAVCALPVVTRDDVRVSGTEVMHRVCAASGRETIGWRLQRENADLQVKIAQLEGRQARIEATQQHLVTQLENAQNTATQLREEHAGFGRQFDRVQTVLVQVTRERDEARAELAKRSASNPEPAPAEREKQHQDDTVVRFALLELD